MSATSCPSAMMAVATLITGERFNSMGSCMYFMNGLGRLALRWRSGLLATALCLTFAGRSGAQEAPESPHVARLRQIILASNPAIAAQRAEVAAAEARVVATGFLEPATLSVEVEEVPGGLDLPSAGSMRADLSRQVTSGGRGSARRRLAASEAAIARVRLHAVERAVSARLDQALVRTAAAQAMAIRIAGEDSLLSRAEEALRVRFSVGEARYVDVLRLRTERLESKAERAAAESEHRAWRQRLVGLAGSDAANARAFALAIDSALVMTSRGLTSEPLALPPSIDSLVVIAGEVAIAQAAIQRSMAARMLAVADTRPVLTAGIGVQRFEDADGHTVGPTGSISVTLPFTAARRSRLGGLAAGRAIEAAEAAYRAAESAVRSDLEADLERYLTARSRLAEFEAALLSGAADERESALSAYQSGELPLIELLDFERALVRIDLMRLRSRADAADAMAELLSGGDQDVGGALTITSDEAVE